MCMPDLLAVGSRGPSVLPVTGPRQRPERPTVVGVQTRTETRRPTPLQWVRYALGGRLPRELSPWVLADTTERSEEHTSELQSRQYLVCRLLLEKKKYLT